MASTWSRSSGSAKSSEWEREREIGKGENSETTQQTRADRVGKGVGKGVGAHWIFQARVQVGSEIVSALTWVGVAKRNNRSKRLPTARSADKSP